MECVREEQCNTVLGHMLQANMCAYMTIHVKMPCCATKSLPSVWIARVYTQVGLEVTQQLRPHWQHSWSTLSIELAAMSSTHSLPSLTLALPTEMEDVKPCTSPTRSLSELLPPSLPHHLGTKAPSPTHSTCCWIQAFSYLLLHTPTAMSGLRIKQQNCRKSKTTALGLINIANPAKWDVILIQEPYIYLNSTLTITS